MKNISQAIIKVMQAVKGMEKNSNVGKGSSSYKGTKDEDVKEVFNKALADNGLCMMPIDIEEETQIDRWVESTQYGEKQKQSVFTKVKVKYLLLHTSGESIELWGYGHGIDSQDKGAGKATTYAMKNCLLYSFMTPVGKIDDTDTTHSDDIDTPKNQSQNSKIKLTEKLIPKVAKWILKKSDRTIETAKIHYEMNKTLEQKLLDELNTQM